ncbi:MAG: futalosine hydrolase [Planctomycetota bacterium]|nr:futalosine hydrolase [Planctomycetota bacterium]
MNSSKPRTLLLVPTALERARLEDCGGFPPELAQVELCGFGLIAPAARTAALIASLEPREVMLVGIAGSYDLGQYPLASALSFGRVAVDGVGAGDCADFRGPRELGFPQWPGDEGGAGPVYEELKLDGSGPLLLTVSAAAGDAQMAERRAQRFPGAAAEDMEGFAVALACHLAQVPLHIVRGISNQVGDRDHGSWRIAAALEAAHRAGLARLEELHNGSQNP